MTREGTCDCCGRAAHPEPVHIENTHHQLCRACFIDYTTQYLTTHADKAADLAGTFQLPWPSTGSRELARILVAGMEQTHAEMRARAGNGKAT